MKTKVILMILFLSLAMTGCANQKNQETNNQSTEIIEETLETKPQEPVTEILPEKESEVTVETDDRVDEVDDTNKTFLYSIEVLQDETVSWAENTTVSGLNIQVTNPSGELLQEITYDYDLSGYPINFQPEVLLADINFDGNDDIVISLGCYGMKSNIYYTGFLWNKKEKLYIEDLSFQMIQNPVIDSERKAILSTWQDGAATYGYNKYTFDKDKFVLSQSLVVDYQMSIDNPNYTESKLKNGEMVALDNENETIQTEWDLDSTQWYQGLIGTLIN